MKKGLLVGLGILLTANSFAADTLPISPIGVINVNEKGTGDAVSHDEFNFISRGVRDITSAFEGLLFDNNSLTTSKAFNADTVTTSTKTTSPEYCIGVNCITAWPTPSSDFTANTVTTATKTTSPEYCIGIDCITTWPVTTGILDLSGQLSVATNTITPVSPESFTSIQSITPDMTTSRVMLGNPGAAPLVISNVDLGSPTAWFRTLWVEDLQIGNQSLYMNGVKILESDPGVEMKFSADTNQQMTIMTEGTEGIMSIASQGEIAIKNSSLIATKDLKIQNETKNGNIILEAKNIVAGTPSIILDSAKVGINQTTPAYTLDVNGDINFTGTLRKNGSPFEEGDSFEWTAGDWTECGDTVRIEEVLMQAEKANDSAIRANAYYTVLASTTTDETAKAAANTKATKFASLSAALVAEANKVATKVAEAHSITRVTAWASPCSITTAGATCEVPNAATRKLTAATTESVKTAVAQKQIPLQTREVVCYNQYGIEVQEAYCFAAASPSGITDLLANGRPKGVKDCTLEVTTYDWQVGDWQGCGDKAILENKIADLQNVYAEASAAKIKLTIKKTNLDLAITPSLATAAPSTLATRTDRIHERAKAKYDGFAKDIAVFTALETKDASAFTTLKASVAAATLSSLSNYEAREIKCVSSKGETVSADHCVNVRPTDYRVCVAAAPSWATASALTALSTTVASKVSTSALGGLISTNADVIQGKNAFTGMGNLEVESNKIYLPSTSSMGATCPMPYTPPALSSCGS